MDKTIFVIDDDRNVLEALTNLLQQRGYNVHSFTNCSNIFNDIKAYKPDLILLDLLLEDEDGREICKSIKKDLSSAHIPVIIISGAADIYNTIIDVQANDVIEKPFTEDVLLARVERQLNDSV